MSNKNDIQAFDQIFKNQLEHAAVNPPAGLWESIASQNAAVNTISTASKISATWIKTLVVSSIVSVSSIIVYQINKPETKEITAITENKTLTENPEPEKITSSEIISNEEKIVESPSVSSKQISKEKNNSNKVVIKEENQTPINTPEINTPPIITNGILSIPKNIFQKETPTQNTKSDSIFTTEENIENETTENKPEENITFPTEKVINIPNVVTPNGDGLNDTYLVEIQGEEYFEMVIYNQKMEKLFETKSKTKAWDCKLPNGDPAPAGNYTVFLKYKFHNQKTENQYIKLKVIK